MTLSRIPNSNLALLIVEETPLEYLLGVAEILFNHTCLMFMSRFSRIRPNLPDLSPASCFKGNDSASVARFFRSTSGDSVLVHCKIATYLCRTSSNSCEMCSLDKSLSRKSKTPGKTWSTTTKRHDQDEQRLQNRNLYWVRTSLANANVPR